MEYQATPDRAVRAEHPPKTLAGLSSLPWWVLLILSVFTLDLVSVAWSFVLAVWARRLNGKLAPIILLVISQIAVVVAAIVRVVIVNGDPLMPTNPYYSAPYYIFLVGHAFYVAGLFGIGNAMEEYYNSTDNIRLALSNMMIFLFGPVYLQYKVHEIADMKKQMESALLSSAAPSTPDGGVYRL